MGGHAGADAAQTAARSIVEELEEPVSPDAIESAVGWACSQVRDSGAGGTTLVMAHFIDEPTKRVLVAWIGDSRAYLAIVCVVD